MENQSAMTDRSQEERSGKDKKEVIFVNARMGSLWKAYSAGTQPADYVHPLTIEVLKEIGIDHRGRTKTVDEFYDHDFDLVVTVCDVAAEKCPLWLGRGKRVHMGFPDPAKATGDEGIIKGVFRQVRDDMAEKIPRLLQMYTS
jgi:arsenate reductase